MKMIRNAAFLVLVAVSLIVGRGQLLASGLLAPYYHNCDDGCTCTIDNEAWNIVIIECENAAPVDECPYAWDSCTDYCEFTLPTYVNTYENPPFPIDCEADNDMEGCVPAALEPPSYIQCQCFCWY